MITSGPRILHLEDEIEWTRKVREYLGDKYDVVATSSLSRAKELLSEKDFHLAIVDISLVPSEGSDVSGFNFGSYLRTFDLWIDLPIIILTGYGQYEDNSMERVRTAFKEYAVSDFLEKDQVTRKELLTAVEHAIVSGPHRYLFREAGRALVVEDIQQWQEKIARILEDEGYQVDTASTYTKAVDKLTSRMYDLATVDIRLEDYDSADVRGVELVNLLRLLRHHVDVIFISAYGTAEEIRRAAFDLGAHDFIDKSEFEPQRLRSRVRKIMSHQVYITANLPTEEKHPVLKVGKKYLLTVSVSRTRPKKGVSHSIPRPVTAGPFEMEVVVNPWVVDVLPGKAQPLLVRSNDTAEDLRFEIIPVESGEAKLEVDIYYKYQSQSTILSRIRIECEIVE